jgi:uncharacterized damage-inducible protein DinB
LNQAPQAMNQAVKSIQEVMLRDLDKLAEEISLYPTEESVWKTAEGITNPGGNLCLHLCGNLQHFIGTIIGKSDYKRNRDAEFSTRDVPKSSLLSEIEKTKSAILSSLPKVTENQMEEIYPLEVFGRPMTTGYFLVHLSAHLGYHLGQVNYHRRLVGR